MNKAEMLSGALKNIKPGGLKEVGKKALDAVRTTGQLPAETQAALKKAAGQAFKELPVDKFGK